MDAEARFDPKTWEGTLPKVHLTEWCKSHKVAKAWIKPYHTEENKNIASCVLPHLKISVTPDWGSPTMEAAEQNAALLAAVHLAGGKLGENCWAPVGDADLKPGSTPQIKAPKGDPTSTPDANSATVEAADSVETVETAVAKVRTHLAAVQARKDSVVKEYEAKVAAIDGDVTEWQRMLDTLQAGGPTAEAALPFVVKSLETSSKRKNGSPASRNSLPKRTKPEPAQDKNPVQELKEVCDKNKWQTPVYEVEQQMSTDGGGPKEFVCKCSIASVPGDFATSSAMANFKLAKQSAALAWLIRLGLRKAEDFPQATPASQ